MKNHGKRKRDFSTDFAMIIICIALAYIGWSFGYKQGLDNGLRSGIEQTRTYYYQRLENAGNDALALDILNDCLLDCYRGRRGFDLGTLEPKRLINDASNEVQ